MKEIYVLKARIDWQDLNVFVAIQRYRAMQYVANQMLELLDMLLLRLSAYPENTQTIKDVVVFLEHINHRSSNGETLLHTLGDRAGLCATQHWALHDDKTLYPPAESASSPSSDSLASPSSWIRDAITCIFNIPDAIRLIASTTASAPSTERPRRLHWKQRYFKGDDIDCPDALTMLQSRHWVYQELISIKLSEEGGLEDGDSLNDNEQIPVTTPRELDYDDWNCRCPGWRDHLAELSGKGLRMGNTPYGKKRDWRCFKRASHGKRYVRLELPYDLEERLG
ncbi:hypothetical protein AC578_4144 [Pseudocercospora eumusae]|uniref:Uncharacterized protein n=1 Tax=Pseudocercospora eumusae TaxID=321146 RepID=A0A139HF73_9PEZI|nr:hypothetical protein AC578_4144 [Pseudocercospora eumusae]